MWGLGEVTSVYGGENTCGEWVRIFVRYGQIHL